MPRGPPLLEQSKNHPRERCCAMRDRSKATIQSRTRPRRMLCEGFRPNEPRRVLPGHVRRLDQSLAFRLKNPLYFSCCLQGGLFCYPLRLHGRARPQKAGPSKSGRFWRNEPEGDPSRTPMQTWPERTQPDLAEPARWRDELEPRQRADGNICDCRRVVPQSFLPFSANEANLRERSQRGKAKRTNAPR